MLSKKKDLTENLHFIMLIEFYRLPNFNVQHYEMVSYASLPGVDESLNYSYINLLLNFGSVVQ